MAAKQPVWGVDVGQCSLKAIKLQAVGPEEFELLAFDLVEHPDILSQGETDASDIVAAAIATFAERNDLSGSKLVVAVPGQQTLTKFTKMPPVEKKKIPDMVQYEASQQIPFDMDEVVWDYQIFGESEGTTEIEVGIFAIRKELIRNYLGWYTEVGLEPQIVQTSPIASYNTARFEMPMPPGEAAVLLDMGAVATDLIVIDGDRIWSRPVPIGGNRFTEALVSAFKISFKKAEKLKRNAASSKYARQIFQAMRPVFADLVSEVQRSIGFYTSTHRDAHITKVIGMGNAVKLPGLQKFLQQNLSMEVTKLNGFKHLRPAAIDKKDEFNDNVMSMAVCYGLALQGLGLAKVESSLLPIEFRRQMLWKKKRPWFAGAAAMLALGAGSIWASNVSANGKISGAFQEDGSLLSSAQFSDDNAAMSALMAAGSQPDPIQKAQTVVSAAKKLKNSFAQADVKNPNAGTIDLLAKYPDNNVFVPRILAAVHEAIGAATAPEIRSATTAQGYRDMARRVPRDNRREVWIAQMYMDYGDVPEALLGNENGRNKPGWAIKLVGVTPLEQPARWIEENVVKELERVGRKPKQGFHIESIALKDVEPRKATRRNSADGFGDGFEGRGGDVGGSPRGGGGGRPRGRGPDGGGRDGGGRPGVFVPGGGGRPEGDPSGGSPDQQRQIQELLKQLERTDLDHLTGEVITNDSSFTLEIIVRKSDTPDNLIPEEYKAKPADQTPKKP